MVHTSSMHLGNFRGRHWAGALTIFAFSLFLFGSYQFLTWMPVLTRSETSGVSRWRVWQRTDYHISLRKAALTEVGCNMTRSTPLSEFGRPEVLEALSLRPTFKGFQNKTGMLNPVNWRPEFKQLRENKTIHWAAFRERHAKVPCDMAQPPLQFPGCLVHINHDYRFIWIKGKKVGGTTIREPLGWICGDHWKAPKHVNMEFCSERWYTNHTVSIAEARKYWKDYFVFAFVRNPYSRYGSSYTYVENIKGTRANKRLPFGKACRHPFLQAFLVGSEGWFKHHIHHIMEQASCLFTQEGLPAVDFVGETEFLHEDLQIVLDEINRRKPPGLPDLEMPEHLRTKNANRHEDYAVSLYERHPACLQEVEKHFWEDFQRLGYEYITQRISSPSTGGSPEGMPNAE